jgi:hypothetical protein
VELKALIGLIYMRGLLGANLLDAKQLWTPNYSPIFAATMSHHRFAYFAALLCYRTCGWTMGRVQ